MIVQTRRWTRAIVAVVSRTGNIEWVACQTWIPYRSVDLNWNLSICQRRIWVVITVIVVDGSNINGSGAWTLRVIQLFGLFAWQKTSALIFVLNGLERREISNFNRLADVYIDLQCQRKKRQANELIACSCFSVFALLLCSSCPEKRSTTMSIVWKVYICNIFAQVNKVWYDYLHDSSHVGMCVFSE